MNIFAAFSLINLISSVFIGTFIWGRDKKNYLNILFGLLSLATAFWSLFYTFWIRTPNPESAFLFLKLLSLAALFIPVFYLHWVLIFLDLLNQKKSILGFSYLTVLFFLPFIFSSYFVKGVYLSKYNYFSPTAGIIHPFYLIFNFALLFGLGLFYLIKSLKTADEIKKQQIKYIILGTLIGSFGGATNFLYWYGIDFPPYLNLSISFFSLTLAYAISKYRLMNLKLAAAQVFTASILIGLLIEIFLSRNINELILRTTLFIAVLIFGILLVKSVLKEVEQREKLEILTKLKSEFLSFASHQVKSPMTIVKGYASLIFDGTYGPVSDEVKETAKKIMESANRMISLVENLLNLRKIEEGKMEYNFEATDINGLAADVSEELKQLADEKKLDFIFESSREKLIVKADPEKLRQVIQNLIDNAIKYTEKGWVKVEVKNEEEVLICVSDSGRGISKELLPNLFQQFSRGSAIAKATAGTGLGLYIAKQIIDAHQGRIWAESEGLDKGSSFFVSLPI